MFVSYSDFSEIRIFMRFSQCKIQLSTIFPVIVSSRTSRGGGAVNDLIRIKMQVHNGAEIYIYELLCIIA